jgi:tetratricopeptide (TPR) repeat protein
VGIAVLLSLLLSLTGCRLTVPMYVWTKPKTSHTPQYGVAIGNLEGNAETIRDYCDLFLEQRPQVQGQIAVYTPTDLVDTQPVTLASTAVIPSQGEIGAMQAARKKGTDFLLMGEVIRDELTIEEPGSNLPPEIQAAINAQTNAAPITARRPEHLTIAWRALDTVTGERVATFTTIMDRNIADQTYPELVWQYPDPRKRVIAANVRETWKSIGPHVVKDRTSLSVSWGWPGSDKIRKGVVLAKNSRWLEAEQEWSDVVTQYPNHHRAWHNLALAAAAREDFSAAKSHIRRALELSDNRQYQATFQWIELRQRDYYQAFALPPPPEGWAFPEPRASSPVAVEGVRPVDLDAEPWYRIIPGVKPPEWSWYAWLTQPVPF